MQTRSSKWVCVFRWLMISASIPSRRLHAMHTFNLLNTRDHCRSLQFSTQPTKSSHAFVQYIRNKSNSCCFLHANLFQRSYQMQLLWSNCPTYTVRHVASQLSSLTAARIRGNLCSYCLFASFINTPKKKYTCKYEHGLLWNSCATTCDNIESLSCDARRTKCNCYNHFSFVIHSPYYYYRRIWNALYGLVIAW